MSVSSAFIPADSHQSALHTLSYIVLMTDDIILLYTRETFSADRRTRKLNLTKQQKTDGMSVARQEPSTSKHTGSTCDTIC